MSAVQAWLQCYCEEKGKPPQNPRELVAFSAHRNGGLRFADCRAIFSSSGKPPEMPRQDELTTYFLGPYLEGAPCAVAGYEESCHDQVPTLTHTDSGTKSWRYALDLRCGEQAALCVYVFLDEVSFRTLTHPTMRLTEIWASLVGESCPFGQGLAVCRKPPRAWASQDEVLLNHHWPRATVLRDFNLAWSDALSAVVSNRGLRDKIVADAGGTSACAFCVPVLCRKHDVFDIHCRPSPDCVKPGQNRWGEAQPSWRDLLVVRLDDAKALSSAQAEMEAGLCDVLRLCIAESEQRLGALHSGTVGCIETLAQALQAQGKLEEAERMHRRVLDAYEETLGVSHPEALTCVANLALIAEGRGRTHDAEKLYRRVLEAKTELLGPSHPGTLAATNDLALALKALGELQEAEQLQRRNLAGSEAEFGARDDHTLAAMGNLAQVLSLQGQLQEAERLHRAALAVKEERLGLEHASTRDTLKQLASVLEAAGRGAEARELLLQGWETPGTA